MMPQKIPVGFMRRLAGCFTFAQYYVLFSDRTAALRELGSPVMPAAALSSATPTAPLTVADSFIDRRCCAVGRGLRHQL